MANVTSSGYQTLLSTPWYLNRISYGQDWRGHYKADPQDFEGSSAWYIFMARLFFFFFFPAHCDWSFAFYAALLFFKIIIYMLVLALCLAHVIVLLLCCWPSSDFISCIDSSTQIWNVIEMFVTSVQTCVSLLNEQMENIVISIKRLPSLITPVQWKF